MVQLQGPATVNAKNVVAVCAANGMPAAFNRKGGAYQRQARLQRHVRRERNHIRASARSAAANRLVRVRCSNRVSQRASVVHGNVCRQPGQNSECNEKKR